MVYQWKLHHFPIEPATAGQELKRISETHGKLTAPTIVEEARPEDAPLHPCFEWDNKTAAQLYREEQARLLVRSLVIEREDKPEQFIRAFVHVQQNEPSYVETYRALGDDAMRREVLLKALAELRAWQKKYEDLEELAAIFGAVNSLNLDAA